MDGSCSAAIGGLWLVGRNQVVFDRICCIRADHPFMTKMEIRRKRQTNRSSVPAVWYQTQNLAIVCQVLGSNKVGTELWCLLPHIADDTEAATRRLLFPPGGDWAGTETNFKAFRGRGLSSSIHTCPHPLHPSIHPIHPSIHPFSISPYLSHQPIHWEPVESGRLQLRLLVWTRDIPFEHRRARPRPRTSPIR